MLPHKNIHDAFETCFFEAEDYFPINREIDKNINVPAWSESICGDTLEKYFYNINKDCRDKCIDIEILMRVKLNDNKEKMFVMPTKEIEIEQQRKLANMGIEVLELVDDFIVRVEEIIGTLEITF